MDVIFLDSENLKILTGYKRPSEQREFLASRGFPFETDRFGKPKVLIKTVEDRLGVKRAKDLQSKPKPKLNFKNEGEGNAKKKDGDQRAPA